MIKKVKSLRTRLMLSLLILLSVAAIASYLSVNYLLNQSIMKFEERSANEVLSRVSTIIQVQADALKASAKDYGTWDDTYAFMNTGSPDYLSTNYTDESMQNLGIQSVLFVGINKQLFSAVTRQNERVEVFTPGNGLLGDVLGAFSSLSPDLLRQGAYLVRWIDSIPTLMVFSPITDTSGEAPANGWLVMLRPLDGAAKTALEQLAGAEFYLQSANANQLALQSEEAHVSVSHTINDSLGKAELVVALTRPPVLQNLQGDAQRLIVFNSLLILLLAVLAVAVLLDGMILRRLHLFARLAEQGQSQSDALPVWPVRGGDELDTLAQALNDQVSQLHAAKTYLFSEARKDSLTGLGNRQLLTEKLNLYQGLQRRDPEHALTLYLIDLDDFKLINDSLGHQAGDALLIGISNRLNTLVRSTDTAIRMGGDEFVVMTFSKDPTSGTGDLAARLLQAVCEPVPYEGSMLTVSASIGIAHSTVDMHEGDLLRNADIAMYKAKNLGKGACVVFTNDMLDEHTVSP